MGAGFLTFREEINDYGNGEGQNKPYGIELDLEVSQILMHFDKNRNRY